MLTLTDDADAVVTSIVTGQGHGADAGLRIEPATGDESEPRFAIRIVPAPEAADQVIDTTASHVYLEEAVAEALSDKILDAGVDPQGAVSFTILPQPA